MQIAAYPTPFLKSNMYAISSQGRTFLVDPYFDADAEAWLLKNGVSSVDFIFLSHEHYDHISGANVLRARFGCPVVCGSVCALRIEDATANFSRYFDAFCSLQKGEAPPLLASETSDFICHSDEIFTGDETRMWQGHALRFVETPGHSPGSSCLVVDGHLLFSGDTLLPTGATITRFPGGNQKIFAEKTLPFLRALSVDTLVYPGHYDSFPLHTHEVLAL